MCALIVFGVLAAAMAGKGAQATPLSPPQDTSPAIRDVVPVAVFGDDDRRDLPDELSSLEGKIGMLYEQSTQTLCTAFCVGKDVIATAAHCLFQPKNGRLPDLSEVTFRLNYGKTFQQSGVFGRRTPFTKNYVAVGTTAFNNEPPLSAPRDWALVKLERSICRFGALKVEDVPVEDLIKKSQEKKIFQVAYHWDYKHWQLAYSKPCPVQRDFDQIKWRFIRQHFIDHDQLLLHQCDTGGASSGSPILMETDTPSAPSVVAINVGTYTRTRILLRKGEVIKKLTPDIIANTGVTSRAFNKIIPELEAGEMIASQDEMKRLQTELHSRGLYTGTIDGELGRGTRTAIMNFETSLGQNPTGLPMLSLLRRFGEERVKPTYQFSNGQGIIAPDQKPEPAATAPNTTTVPKPLRRTDPPAAKSPFNPFGRF